MLIFSKKQGIVFCPASFFPSPDSTIIWEILLFTFYRERKISKVNILPNKINLASQ